MQEIAIRVTLRDQERLALAEYERVVGSVATVAALAAWLPTPDARLVLRGRGAEPVRVETVSYGTSFAMLVVLDQRSPAVERAAGVLSALIGSVRAERVEDDAAGVAGEIDRLDRSAPRGRTVAERTLRTFLEGARADVLAGRSTARVRAASALVRLAEDGALVTVERVADARVPEVEEIVVEDVVPELGGAVVLPEPTPVAVSTDDPAPTDPQQSDGNKAGGGKGDGKKKDGGKKDGGKKRGKKKDGGEKRGKKKDGGEKDGKKKDDKKKSGKKDGKKKSGKKKDSERAAATSRTP